MKERKGITRVEVIENGSIKFSRWECSAHEDIQDAGRTLKIFIGEKE